MFNVNNRVQIALPRLPDEVRRNGVIVQKRSFDILLVVSLVSPDNSRDTLYLSNYAWGGAALLRAWFIGHLRVLRYSVLLYEDEELARRDPKFVEERGGVWYPAPARWAAAPRTTR